MKRIEAIANSWIWVSCLVLYLVVIFIISHMQRSQLPSVLLWDKGIHFFEYLPVGFFVAGWFRIVLRQKPSWFIAIAAILAIFLLGGMDELHQHFVPTRDSSFFDVIADVLGGTVGVGISFGIFRKIAKPQTNIS